MYPIEVRGEISYEEMHSSHNISYKHAMPGRMSKDNPRFGGLYIS